MATSAEIQKYSHHQDGYVEYFIKVVHNGRIWGIRKRYSHFVTLHDHLQKNGFSCEAPLPKKSWKKFDETRLKKRLKSLQDYIDCLLRTFPITENSLLKEFFEVETVWLQIAKSKSFKEIQSAEKLTRLPKTLQSWMIAIPYTRNRSNTNGRPPSANVHFMSPAYKDRTKSVSFSSFSMPMPSAGGGRSVSRKESLAGEMTSSGKDRKFSVDIFNLSYNSGNNYSTDHLSAAASAVKKGAYLKSTQVLWKHYQEEALFICEEANFIRPGSAGSITTSLTDPANKNNNNTAAVAGLKFRQLVTTASTHPALLGVMDNVLKWEEENLRATMDKSADAISAKAKQSLSSSPLAIGTDSLSIAAEDISLAEEEIVGIPIKDVVILQFTQLRGVSHDSKVSVGTAADTESVGTSIESLSVKG